MVIEEIYFYEQPLRFETLQDKLVSYFKLDCCYLQVVFQRVLDRISDDEILYKFIN